MRLERWCATVEAPKKGGFHETNTNFNHWSDAREHAVHEPLHTTRLAA